MAGDELYEKGIAIREEMLGPEHGRAKVESQPDFTRDFEELVTRYCFGSVWSRDQISRGTRSMLTIAMLVAMGKNDELKLHIRATRNTGVTRDEVKEIMMHAAIYAGVPAAFGAFQVAAQIFDEMDKEAGAGT